MSKLYYLEYGCSIVTESLIVSISEKEPDPDNKLDMFGRESAIESYYSYDCNYPSEEDCEGLSEEEISELMEEEEANDAFWSYEPFDPENFLHQATLKEQDNKPFEI